MKVCYLWVKDFRNFANQGFNFSSKTKFHFDERDNILSKINISPLPIDFFVKNDQTKEETNSGGKLSEVTGLIGRNGAGKSNVLDALLKSLKGAKSTMPCDFLLITEEDRNYTCYKYFDDKSMEVICNFPIKMVDYDGSMKNLKVVFFSNVYDGRENVFDKEVTDLSANSYYNNRFIHKTKSSDFENQINFINHKSFVDLNIDVPQKVQIGSRIWFNRRNRSTIDRLFENYSDRYTNFQNKIRSRLRDIKEKNRFFLLIKYGFLIKLVDIVAENANELDLEDLFFALEMSNRTEKSIDAGIDWLYNTYRNYSELFLSSVQRDRSLKKWQKKDHNFFDSRFHFIKELDFNYKELTIEYNKEGKRNKSIEYFNLNFETSLSRKFISKFNELFSYDSFFEINWVGISSGHKAYLNLFASISSELRYAKSENLLLCIDEGDLYLHPKWQTEFFDKIITILPKLFSGNIQLILTSHSPFILSDLPKQCVTIVDPEINASQSVIDGHLLPLDTFAGNLYSLYRSPFFLENKRLSDFSSSKIKYVIDRLKNIEVSDLEKKALDQTIRLVGDKIIKLQLEKLREND